MADALILLLASQKPPAAYLSRDWFPHTDFSLAKHTQRAVSNFPQLPVDGVRTA